MTHETKPSAALRAEVGYSPTGVGYWYARAYVDGQCFQAISVTSRADAVRSLIEELNRHGK
jgi:hypothetical protein